MKKKVIDVVEETHVHDNRAMCTAPAVFNEAGRGIKDIVESG